MKQKEGYKVHTEILRSKAEEENELKSLTLESQGGYRRERGTIINMYKDYLIQRKKREEDGKVYNAFINLKVIFNNMERKQIQEVWKKKKQRKKE